MSPHPASTAKKTLEMRRAVIAQLRDENIAGTQTIRAARDGETREPTDGLTEVLVRLSDGEWAELCEIDAAIARIDAGTWGTCARCSRAIGAKRLAVVPEARTCVACEK